MADIEASSIHISPTAGPQPPSPAKADIETKHANTEYDHIPPIREPEIITGGNNSTTSLHQHTESRHLKPTPGSLQAYLEDERIQRPRIETKTTVKFKCDFQGLGLIFSRESRRIRIGDCARIHGTFEQIRPLVMSRSPAGVDPPLVLEPIYPFLVFGLFKGKSQVPQERLFFVRHPKWLFWQLWWNIILLRGFGYFFSLKDVQGFRLYNVSLL
jgi:hypothetical protein